MNEDGAARIGATLFGELLNATFANVGQHAVRKVARETFEHLLNLELKFHLSRHTGGLTRAIDRGTKCVRPISGWVHARLMYAQRNHVYSISRIIPNSADCSRDIFSLWYTGMVITFSA